jgi:ABC-2 type transport system ATP-binding protein
MEHTTGGDYVVSVDNISFAYNKKSPLFDNFSLNIARKKITAVLGHNGAGKTTLLRLLGKLVEPSKGSIQWNLLPQEKIYLMPEGLGLYPRLSGYENIRLRLLSFNKKADKDTVLSVLRTVNLEDHEKKPAGRYSAGMKRRLSLACSLLASPSLLLLDEPLTGIDPVSQRIMINLIGGSINENPAMVIVTHDIHLVKEICGCFAIIRDGKNVYGSDDKNEIANIEDIYFKYAGN